MQILLVSATKAELKPILSNIKELSNHKVESVITGVGMTATAFALGRVLAGRKYDLAINIGLAGAFDKNLELAEVVNVIKDQFSEEGAEDGDSFLSLDEIGLRSQQTIFRNGKLNATFPIKSSTLKQVTGITVNTVHGNEESIKKIVDRLQPQVESMEGAAFFYACNMSSIPCLQIRAISNYVEKRNRAHWKIEKALTKLSETLIQLLKTI